MRITLEIDDELFANAKELAVREGRSVEEMIEEGLRLRLDSRNEAFLRSCRILPVYPGASGLAKGIEPSSNRSMRGSYSRCVASTGTADSHGLCLRFRRQTAGHSGERHRCDADQRYFDLRRRVLGARDSRQPSRSICESNDPVQKGTEEADEGRQRVCLESVVTTEDLVNRRRG